MLVRLWLNGLRSNVTPLKHCKLDIGNTCNNLSVRRVTLIGISLVLFHRHHMEGPQTSTDKKCYNHEERGHLTRECPLALNYFGNFALTETSKTTIEDESTM
jgi:hypothetical protein